MTTTAGLQTALDLAREWRPQAYGRKRAHEIDDAIVEPLWEGPRMLLGVEDGVAAPFHEGTRLGGPAAVLEQLLAVSTGSALVLEGHLTEQALATGEGATIVIREKPPGTVTRLLGNLGTGKRDKMIQAKEAAAAAAKKTEQVVSGAAGPLAFVATDLLWLDGDALLDVPLLERKRLLDSAIGESELVRKTAFVRPTATGSLIGWKALGFRTLAYKAANGRYRPGEPNDGWAIVEVAGSSLPPLGQR
jgi:hypothetical protein